MKMKQYNICDQCAFATNGCEKENRKCFYPETHEEILVCPYCGHEVTDFYDLADLGLLEGREVNETFNCDKCGNAIDVNSSAKYYITASPADETAVERLGCRDYR